MSIHVFRKKPDTQPPIEAANLITSNLAELWAYARRFGGKNTFDVSMHKDTWVFNEAGCREAAEFFTKLADDLRDNPG